MNLKEIIGFHPIPIFSFYPSESVDEMLFTAQTIMSKIREGKVKPQFFDASQDSLLASMVKKENDAQKALFCAWIAYMKFEEMIGIYLTPKAFERCIQKFGSPFDKIVAISINEVPA